MISGKWAIPFLVAGSVYLTCAALEAGMVLFHTGPMTKEEAAAAEGRIWDKRSKIEVLVHLRASGVRAHPRLSPSLVVEDSRRRAAVLPLGGVSNATTVLCNETGAWVLYESDEHGFRNPKDLYNRGLDVMGVGDSYAQGLCVEEESTIFHRLRESYPATLNFGNAGNGPLAELAAVREYASVLQPRYIVWFYYEGNDCEDLGRELESSLSDYLNVDYRQGIYVLQDQCDAYLSGFVDRELTGELSRNELRNAQNYREQGAAISRILKLQRIRRLIHSTGKRLDRESGNRCRYVDDLKGIVALAKSAANEYGSTLVLVELPAYQRIRYGRRAAESTALEQYAREIGVPYLVVGSIFEEQGDPVKFFPYRQDGHYTAEGYHLIGTSVAQLLRQLESKQ